MARVYIGNLDSRVGARELEDEFRGFGVLRKKPPGFAFIGFDNMRDAQDAIRELDGENGCRVELSHKEGGDGRDRDGDRDPCFGGSYRKCYQCGEPVYFARECRLRLASSGMGSVRRCSHSHSRRLSQEPESWKKVQSFELPANEDHI